MALNWHEQGITTADEAKLASAAYTKDAFAVMKAFGLTERRPGVSEQKMMDKWFKEWGFSRELVMEACSRTLQSAHTPSFPYTDKILEAWKAQNVHSMADVKDLDARRKKREKATGTEAGTSEGDNRQAAGREALRDRARYGKHQISSIISSRET